MPWAPDEQVYKRVLGKSLKDICFDRLSGESFLLEELFYPLELEEGRLAFQSYAEQMERARRSEKAAPTRAPVLSDEERRQRVAAARQKLEWLRSRHSGTAASDEEAAVSRPAPEEADPETGVNSVSNMPHENAIRDNGKECLETERAPQGALCAKTAPTSALELSDEERRLQISAARRKLERLRGRHSHKAASDEAKPEASGNAESKTLRENAIRATGKELLEKIKDHALSELPAADAEIVAEPAVDLLFEEPLFPHSSLIVSDEKGRSRILTIASAGHGKTTLLRRVALFYCHPQSGLDEHRALKKAYGLSGSYIPCLILLRNIGDGDFSLERAMQKSVAGVFRKECPESAQEGSAEAEQIKKWVAANKEKFLLLIDGLDELSDAARLDFLRALDEYLLSASGTHVIMSSRAAGLSEPGIRETLRKMAFRGRSIIPLTDKEAKKYSERWIDVTQPEEQREALKDAVDQVMNQSRFQYLREFMRTPLELLVILKQLASDTLSLNRYYMFRDMLWAFFTDHVKKGSQKSPVFDDTMTLLSFIAYQMQLKDSLAITTKEMEALLGELNHLSFHTRMSKNGTLQDYIDFLDELAANVGVIEKDDRTDEKAYAFPIRAYQEFLTAYACCHLRLLPGLSRPDPYEVVRQHMNDSRWRSITNFVLSDLGANNQGGFDTLILLLFETVTDMEQLRSIVEADLTISSAHAERLCKRMFAQEFLGKEQKELLVACMNTKSAFAYVRVLKKSYQSAEKPQLFVQASAIASILWNYGTQRSAVKEALENLQSGTKRGAQLGAAMLVYLAKAILEEELCEYTNTAKRDLKISDEMLRLLADNAGVWQDVWPVKALTSLWLTRLEGTEKIAPLLVPQLAQPVLGEINSWAEVARKLCLTSGELKEWPEYQVLEELFNTLGTFPPCSQNQALLTHGSQNLYVSALMQIMYDFSRMDAEMDQVALALACRYYCWDDDKFAMAWGDEVCKGIPSESVHKELSSCKREQNHFELVRGQLVSYEKRYQVLRKPYLNVLPSERDTFSLFRSGYLLEAARHCAAVMGKELDATELNLAFLLRYGKLDPKMIGKGTYRIPDLLAPGLAQGEAYAMVNMALYQLEQARYEEAAEYLSHIDDKGWDRVANWFWYPELWQKDQVPEGALVCVLAQQRGACHFEDYSEMLRVVRENYPQLPDCILSK